MKKTSAFLIIFLLCTLHYSCFNCVKGTGEVATKALIIEPFNAIEVAGSTDVHIKQGVEQMVEVKAHPNIIPLLSKTVKDGTWEMSFSECIRSDVQVYITVPDLRALSITGSGTITGGSNFNVQDMKLEIGGSGEITLNLNGQNITTGIAGSGSVNLTGSAVSHKISIAGSGDVNAYDFEVLNTSVEVAGSGDVQLNTTGLLEVSIAGSGNVNYKGEPERVKSDIAGSGELVKK